MDIGLIAHVLLYNDKKEVLIMRRVGSEKVLPGYWDVPGGTVKDGEDPKEAAFRELREEAGLNQKNGRLFFHTSNIDKGKNKQFVRLIFMAHYEGGKIILNPDEHEQYLWIKYGNFNSGGLQLVDYLENCFRALDDMII